jgi:hypothetical protein
VSTISLRTHGPKFHHIGSEIGRLTPTGEMMLPHSEIENPMDGSVKWRSRSCAVAC